MTTADEDEGDVELSSIKAIFPEILIDSDNSHKARLDLEVAPPNPISVTFKPELDLDSIRLTDGEVHVKDGAENNGVEDGLANNGHALRLTGNGILPRQTTRTLSHLPPLRIDIELPEGYPDEKPPIFKLRTEPAWIPKARLEKLELHGEVVWEEFGRMASVFAYIDYLQTEAETVFGLADSGMALDESFEGALIGHDKKTKRAKFDRQTFDCGICLSPKRGSACYQMQHCGHVFCKECLQDFYNNAITEGDIASVKCLDPDCGEGSGRDRKQRAIHPTELLDIPLDKSKVKRYVDMKLKKMLESDKTTIYCPRKWCQAPARAAKYARYNPEDLEHWPEDDMAVEEPVANGGNGKGGDRLAVCSKCQYAFCRVCNKGWHGDFIHCLPPLKDGQLSAEEKASYDFIRQNTSPCPYCNSPVSKTHGCNHMTCVQCETHFCYLCSSWLPKSNPYKHFNIEYMPCYQRLWDLEEGDEGQGDREIFAGARGGAMNELALAQAEALMNDNTEHEGEGQREINQNQNQGHDQNQNQHWQAQDQLIVQHADVPDDINRVALQRFLAMAANDEEDGWDSDDLAD